MKKYREEHDYLLKLKRENDLVFNLALQLIIDNGTEKCASYNIEKIAEKIPENSMFSKQLQIAMLNLAKEISSNVKPWHIYIFFKEEMETFERTKIPYNDIKSMLVKVLEHVMFPLDGGTALEKEELMEIMDIDEEEWDEIWR